MLSKNVTDLINYFSDAVSDPDQHVDYTSYHYYKNEEKAQSLIQLFLADKHFNWNVVIPSGRFKGFTLLFALTRSANFGCEPALNALEALVQKKNLYWNTTTVTGPYAGETPLFWTVHTAAIPYKQGQNALKHLPNIPNLLWHSPVLAEGCFKDCTPLRALAMASYLSNRSDGVKDQFSTSGHFMSKPTKPVLDMLPSLLLQYPHLNFNEAAYCKISNCFNDSVLYHFIQYMQWDYLEENAEAKKGIETLILSAHNDWNNALRDCPYHAGETPLFVLAKAAAKGKPFAIALLDKLIHRRELNWDATIAKDTPINTPLKQLQAAAEKYPEAKAVLEKRASVYSAPVNPFVAPATRFYGIQYGLNDMIDLQQALEQKPDQGSVTDLQNSGYKKTW